MNAMPDLYPAVVREYDVARRLARIEMPGITDGGDVMLQAEFCNPIGDKSEHTAIRVLPGDRVWVSFANGDPRYPVIMGYRPKQVGNELEYRRWHHANIELDADGVLHLKCTRLVIDASSEVVVNTATATINASSSVAIESPTTTISGDVAIGGNTSIAGETSMSGGATVAASVSVGGSLAVVGTISGDGINLKTHTHAGVQRGGGSTDPAQ